MTASTLNTPPEPEIGIDVGLIRELLRRKALAFSLFGLAVFGGLEAYQLLIQPQSYAASCSIAVQQPAMGGGGTNPLAALMTQSAPKKYIGIIKSRRLAEGVEDRVHLQAFYHLPTREKALLFLLNGIKPEDNPTDGLLLLKLTLPGPARFARDPENRRTRVKSLVADATNAYQMELSKYYKFSDNDADLVKLRGAQRILDESRQQYEQANNKVRQFVIDQRRQTSLTSATMSSDGPAAGNNGLNALYAQLTAVDSDIASSEAANKILRENMDWQLKHLNELPSEDALLTDAREKYNNATTRLNTLKLSLGDDNPRVRGQQEIVRLARVTLDTQTQGVKLSRTTDQAELARRLSGLRARRETLTASVRDAESKLPIRREATLQLALLRGEQELALKKLEQAEQGAVQLEMMTVSGQSRFITIDSALPAEAGAPGTLKATFFSLLGTGFLLLGRGIWEYLRAVRRRALLTEQHGAAAAHEIADKGRNGAVVYGGQNGHSTPNGANGHDHPNSEPLTRNGGNGGKKRGPQA